MKQIYILVIAVLFFSCSYSQETINYRYSDSVLSIPVNERQVIYEKIENFDSSLSSEFIFSKIKDAIAPLFPAPGVGYNYSFFKLNNITSQIINEDKDNKSITAHLFFKTIKNKNDNVIKPDVLVISKARFIVKGNRMKCIISDINIQYYSVGMAVLAGSGNSLISIRAEDVVNKPKDGIVTGRGEYGKAIYSALYILEKKTFEFIKNRIQSDIKRDDF